jgi:hypothetical protein
MEPEDHGVWLRPEARFQVYRSPRGLPDTIRAMPGDARTMLVRDGFYRVAIAVWLAAAALPAGCSGEDAVRSNRRAPEDRFDPTVVLEGKSAERAERGMVSATAGYPGRPLVAEPGGRWSDVPMAIRNVARESFRGVRSFETSGDRIVAATVAEDGQPGTVTAARAPDGAISFECSLGTFPDSSRDAAFASALRAELARLGAIRRPQG